MCHFCYIYMYVFAVECLNVSVFKVFLRANEEDPGKCVSCLSKLA